MNYQNFKCRASAGGKLATNPRAKSETLSETTKTYLKEWATEQIFGVKNEISSKYIERGIEMEDTAIDFAISVLDLPFVIKNEKHFEDEYFTGTPDIITDEVVYDIKCSWSCFTFPIFENEVPTKDYIYQLQIYMHLTGLKKAVLAYVLLDNANIEHYYTVEDKKRIKTFQIDYDPSVIDMLQERVLDCRNFLKSL